MTKPRTEHRKSYNEPGHAHELTFSCQRGYPLLSKERPCLWLAESIQSARVKLNFALWSYVFMPNHVHLIVYPQEANYDISEYLKLVKHPVSRKALAFLRQETPGWLERLKATRGQRVEYHFWQRGGGYDRNITEPSTLEKMIEYIHQNPVRKGLVEKAKDWKWSSAGYYMGEEFPPLLLPDPIPPEWCVGMSDD